MARDTAYLVWKGVYYFATRERAIAWAQEHGWPIDRIIAYKKGHAIQLYVSGPYAGPDCLDPSYRGTFAPVES